MENNENTASAPQNAAANGNNGGRKKLGLKARIVRFWFYKDNHIRHWRSLMFGLSLIIIFSLSYPYILKCISHSRSYSEMGSYGDLYGGLNAFFAGCAFIGLVITILLQIQEMRDARKDFRAQANLMLRQNINACMFDQINFMYGMRDKIMRDTKSSSSIETIVDNLEYIADFSRKQMHDKQKLVDDEVVKKINNLRVGLNAHYSWSSFFVQWCMRIDRIAPAAEVGADVNNEYKYYYWDCIQNVDQLLIYLNSLISRKKRGEEVAYVEKYRKRNKYVANAIKELGYNNDSFTILRHLLDIISETHKNTVELEKEEIQSIYDKFNDDGLEKYTIS